MAEEYTQGEFTLSTDRGRMDAAVIHGFLARSYWARDIPLAIVKKAIEHSLCFGVFEGNSQVGFARVITDYATFAYLGDVFVLEEYRGRGLSKWLMERIMAHPDLQGLRRWNLATRDAHSLYARHGFAALAQPQSYMEITDMAVYLKGEYAMDTD